MKNVYIEYHWDQPDIVKYSASLKLAWSVAEICIECKQIHSPHESCFETDFSKIWETRIADSENKCKICKENLPHTKAEKVLHLGKHTHLQNILGGAYKLTESSWIDVLKYSYEQWQTLQTFQVNKI